MPLCTWARLAAATGSRESRANGARGSAGCASGTSGWTRSSARRRSSAASASKGGMRSWRVLSAAEASTPMRSSRDARVWPSLTYTGPREATASRRISPRSWLLKTHVRMTRAPARVTRATRATTTPGLDSRNGRTVSRSSSSAADAASSADDASAKRPEGTLGVVRVSQGETTEGSSRDAEEKGIRAARARDARCDTQCARGGTRGRARASALPHPIPLDCEGHDAIGRRKRPPGFRRQRAVGVRTGYLILPLVFRINKKYTLLSLYVSFSW